MRAGAAWEKWGGPCAAKARPSFLRAGAAWEKEGRAQPRPDLPFPEEPASFPSLTKRFGNKIAAQRETGIFRGSL